MALTKTKFINYIRCPRFCALEEIKNEELNADVSLEDYLEEEQKEVINELLGTMFDENGDSIIDIEDPQLQTMLPYYNKIEILATKQVKKMFGGNPISVMNNKNQESFDFNEDGIKYLCYVDIYNENKKFFDIIEVKATTSKKFLELGPSSKDDLGNKEIVSIFSKSQQGIYCLKDELDKNKIEENFIKKYNYYKDKLMDKYNDCGHYVYDLLVQRMIIEHDLKQHGEDNKINNIHYFLAVLNSNYVFNGKYDEYGEPIYDTDENGEDIIVLFDFTKLTKELMDQVELDRKKVVRYLKEMNVKQCDLGIYCQYKKTTKCKFLESCFFKVVPKKNSILNYIDAHHGFKDEMGNKYMPYELINMGKVNMLDIPETWLKRVNNIIQRKVIETGNAYINKNKIQGGLKQISYPLYHLDFETFPCPLPRYKGEKCYTQSLFQFSLHIEKEPGKCDKNQDHYEFLAYNHQDLREELVKKLCDYINPEKGTIIVYNQIFEKSRLKELAELFPVYRKKLLKMVDIIFDLMYIVKNNTKLYKNLGYNDIDAKTINYYHQDLNGSFSIKKILPIFALELNYDNLDVSNGTEALITYANFPNYSKEEFNKRYQALLKYCKQDTWAMVVILNKLREIVN